MIFKLTSFACRSFQYQRNKEMQRFILHTLPLRNIHSRHNCLLDKWSELNNERRHFSALDEGEPKSKNSNCVQIDQLTETFPDIVHDFVSNPQYSDMPEMVSWFKGVLEYNVPTGKRVRALSLLHAYKDMEDSEKLTSQNVKLANILGWCVEMLQGMTTVMDDIIDGSETRRGKKCWYKKEGVGHRAIMDILLLENYMHKELKKYFSHLPIYVHTVRLMQETIMKLSFGELLDTMPLNAKTGLTINNFTRKHFQTLTKYKTTSSTFELPYSLARCLSNKFHTEIPPQIQETISKLGEFFQIQNDFMDCYDNAAIGNKIGNDIEEGKCSWLVVVALEKVNDEQRRLLETHYGKGDPQSVQIVKELYNDLEIPKAYAIYEKQMFDFIEDNIEHVSKITRHELIFKNLKQLYEKYT